MSRSAKQQAEEQTALATIPQSNTAVIAATDLEAYKDVIAASQAEAQAMTQSDLQMPFLALTQALTKQRQRGEANYIPGLEEGDFFNTVTNEIYKMGEGVRFIPVKYEFVYNVWRPRNLGGGFLGSFKDRDAAIQRAVEVIMTEGGIPGVVTEADATKFALSRDKDYGNWVKDTANQYGLVETADGTWAPALLSLTSSKLTPGRAWNTTIQMQLAKPGPGRVAVRWDKIWLIDSVSKTKGENRWFTLKTPTPVRPTSAEEWRAAADFFNMLRAGAVTVDYSKSGEVDETTVDAVVEETPGDEKPKF